MYSTTHTTTTLLQGVVLLSHAVNALEGVYSFALAHTTAPKETFCNRWRRTLLLLSLPFPSVLPTQLGRTLRGITTHTWIPYLLDTMQKTILSTWT